MLKLVLYRVAMTIPVMVVVTMIIVILVGLSPGSAAYTLLGVSATPETVADLEHQLGLDLPWYVQWWNYMVQLVQGNMGNSYVNNAAVSTVLNQRLPVTLSLMILSTALSALVGCALGVLSAVRLGFWGKVVDAISMFGVAIPSFWLAMVLAWFFAVQLKLLPSIGYVNFEEDPAKWFIHLMLPVVALSLVGTSMLAKTTRDAVLEIRNRDFIRTLRANGMSSRSLLFKHVVKNASVNVVTVVSLVFISALASSVFVENVFALPGLGTIATVSTLNGDIPLLQGVSVYFTLIVVAVNILVDISYSLLNPKVRAA